MAVTNQRVRTMLFKYILLKEKAARLSVHYMERDALIEVLLCNCRVVPGTWRI